MKNFIALVTLLIGFNTAQATSVHPCTPSIQAQPTYIYCRQGGNFYSITVNVLMSNRQQCDEPVEYKTANVSISDQKGKVLSTLEIVDGQFSYTLSATGGATFKSKLLSLDLKK